MTDVSCAAGKVNAGEEEEIGGEEGKKGGRRRTFMTSTKPPFRSLHTAFADFAPPIIERTTR